MKKLLLLSFLMACLCSGMLFAQGVELAEETNWPLIIIAGIIALAEVALRAFPDKNFTGLIGLIINLLKLGSDYLNNKSDIQKSKS